jgi:nitrogenase iron protein NifH
VRKALEDIGGDIVGIIPRDGLVQKAENEGKTVIEAFPDSQMANTYFTLAKDMIGIWEGGEGHEQPLRGIS